MIEDLGHAAGDVTTAAGALEIVHSELPIDMVITDYAMPEMNGSQLAAEIRRIRPHVPVVIATGYAGAHDGALGLPRLDKPYTPQNLADLIETRPTPQNRDASIRLPAVFTRPRPKAEINHPAAHPQGATLHRALLQRLK